jgi:hypothetical protein
MTFDQFAPEMQETSIVSRAIRASTVSVARAWRGSGEPALRRLGLGSDVTSKATSRMERVRADLP